MRRRGEVCPNKICFAPCRSPENPLKKPRKSLVLRKLVLDTIPRCDIDLYHATLLHGSGCQDARIASAELAAIDSHQSDSVPTATAHRQTANPTLDTEGREARTRGNSKEVKEKRACRLLLAADKP
jgi:hypothetical protein